MSSLARLLARLIGAGRTVILTYHRVLDGPDVMRPGETTAAAFDAQMRVLSSNFPVTTFGEYIQSFDGEMHLDNSVIVTFDDGYRDNFDVALPILQKYGLSATFFIATGFRDGGMMWNDRLIEAVRAAVGQTIDLRDAGGSVTPLATFEDASNCAKQTLARIKRLPQQERATVVEGIVQSVGHTPSGRMMMVDSEIAALANSGMEVGAHTVTHPILASLSVDEARTEIMESKRTLERILGSDVKSFAYPNGRPGKDYSAVHVDLVRECGFAGAATTQWGCATRLSSPFEVPRKSLWGTGGAGIWLRLTKAFA